MHNTRPDFGDFGLFLGDFAFLLEYCGISYLGVDCCEVNVIC